MKVKEFFFLENAPNLYKSFSCFNWEHCLETVLLIGEMFWWSIDMLWIKYNVLWIFEITSKIVKLRVNFSEENEIRYCILLSYSAVVFLRRIHLPFFSTVLLHCIEKVNEVQMFSISTDFFVLAIIKFMCK